MRVALKCLAAVIVACVLFTTAGCTNEDSSNTDPSRSSAKGPKTPEEGAVFFGDPFTWSDGLETTISASEEFTPDDAEEGYDYLTFTVTVTNGSDNDFDPSMFGTGLWSGGESALTAYNTETPADRPVDLVAPGETIEFLVSFKALDAGDLKMEVVPSYGHEVVNFVPVMDP